MRIYLILALVLAIIVTIFAVQNNEPVDVAFLTFQLDGSLALVLMITLTLGIIIGILVSAPASLRRRMEIGGLKKNLRELEKELTAARQETVMSPPPKEEAPTPDDPPAHEISEENSEG